MHPFVRKMVDKTSTPPSNEKFRRRFIIQRRSQHYIKNGGTQVDT
jgi:hypothetical protein